MHGWHGWRQLCLGIPGKIVAVGEDIHQLAQVDVCGVKRDVNIGLICEGKPPIY